MLTQFSPLRFVIPFPKRQGSLHANYLFGFFCSSATEEKPPTGERVTSLPPIQTFFVTLLSLSIIQLAFIICLLCKLGFMRRASNSSPRIYRGGADEIEMSNV